MDVCNCLYRNLLESGGAPPIAAGDRVRGRGDGARGGLVGRVPADVGRDGAGVVDVVGVRQADLLPSAGGEVPAQAGVPAVESADVADDRVPVDAAGGEALLVAQVGRAGQL